MKSNKERILKLYFEDKLKQVDIAKKLKISRNAVSKTVKEDSRYIEEKTNRKNENKIKHNKEIQKRVEIKRRNKGASDVQLLKKMHEQASFELSGSKKTMNNRAFRDWNSSVYRYDKKRQCYVLKNGIITGADVPRKINWKNF